MTILGKVKRFPRDSGVFVKERAGKFYTGKPTFRIYDDMGEHICCFCGKRFNWQPVIFNIMFPERVACSQACKRNHLHPGHRRKVKSRREIEIEQFVEDLEFKGRIK
jgi:hypothetical protein